MGRTIFCKTADRTIRQVANRPQLNLWFRGCPLLWRSQHHGKKCVDNRRKLLFLVTVAHESNRQLCAIMTSLGAGSEKSSIMSRMLRGSSRRDWISSAILEPVTFSTIRVEI